MAISGLLSQIKNRNNVQPQSASPASKKLNKATSGSGMVGPNNVYTYQNGESKYIDPIVAKLKAARKQEELKKQEKVTEERKKKGLPVKKTSNIASSTAPKPRTGSSKPSSTAARPSRASSKGSRSSTPVAVPIQAPARKMNFKELMKKAGTIDTKKLSINPIIKPKTPEEEEKSKKTPSKSPGRSRSVTPSSIANKASREDRPRYKSVNQMRENKGKMDQRPPKSSRSGPLPIAKPSSQLAKKLETKKSSRSTKSRYRDEEEDSYESDFIVSDEEEKSRDLGYDREEIWSLFDRSGRKRAYAYDDYDSDDMEATGAEILEEENRSSRTARLEDLNEEKEERRRAEAKRTRLGK